MNKKAIGKKLVMLRGNRPIQIIAQMLGISPSALSMYENGNRIPRDEVKIKIAHLYNTSVEEIFFK